MNITPGYTRLVTDEELRKVLKESLSREAHDRLTVCEQLRFLYDMALQIPEADLREIMIDQLVDAIKMVKSMNSKLSWYREQMYGRKSATKKLTKLHETKERLAMRKSRPTLL